MAKLKPNQLIERYSRLKTRRGNWETLWQECADYHVPNKATINIKRTSGDKRGTFLLDNTGMVSFQLLAGALQSFVTNPSTLFFSFTTGDEELDMSDGVGPWLQNSAKRVHAVLNDSNFHTQAHEMYQDLVVFGTSPLSIEEDNEKVVRFSSKNINHSLVDENAKKEIDQVYNKLEWNARQLVEEFGEENVGTDVLKAFEKNDDQMFKVFHGIYPAEDEGMFGWISQWVLEVGLKELRVSGFREFPYAVPRWSKMPEETYGRSPAMTALPEMKSLNKMMEITIRGAQKVIDPPLQAEDDGSPLQIRTRPGGINYRRPGSAPITPIFNDSRVDFGFQILEEGRKRVREAFFVDQLKLREADRMTAAEVSARLQEAARLMGPVVGRLKGEFLTPVVDRVFNIMMRRDMFEQPPAVLEERDIGIQFVSLVGQAQRESVVNSMLRFVETVSPFVQVDPSAVNRIDADQAIKIARQNLSAPTGMLRSDKEVEALKQAQAEQAQQLQQQEAQSQGAVDAKNAAGAVQAVQGG